MTAIGILGDFVRKTGDTMTGDLILQGASTDLTVGGVLTDGFQGITGDVMSLLSTVLSTGLTSGGTLSINANPALVDIAATTGWVYSYNPYTTLGPTNPQLTYVNYPGATGVALVGPPTQTATFWLLDSTGTLIQQATAPTRVQHRTHIFLGVTSQIGGTINEARSMGDTQGQLGPQLHDLISSLGAFPVGATSHVITPNGANLRVNTTGGPLFIESFGVPNYLDPHIINLAAQAPASFRHTTANSVLPTLLTSLDVANYDPNGAGVVTPVGGGSNQSSIFRVFASGGAVTANQMGIQYGQASYGSLALAVAAINVETFTPNPVFRGGAVVAWIAAIRTATNLSDPAQAKIVRAPKFANP